MKEPEYFWRKDGVRQVLDAGLGMSEVDDALRAPPRLRRVRDVDGLRVVTGVTSGGKVLAVLCRRTLNTQRFTLLGARLLTAKQIDQWRNSVLAD